MAVWRAAAYLPRMPAQTYQEGRQNHWTLQVYAAGIALHTGMGLRVIDLKQMPSKLMQHGRVAAHKLFLELINQAQACTYNQPHLRTAAFTLLAESWLLSATRNASHV